MPDPDEFHETDEQMEGRADALRESVELDSDPDIPSFVVDAARGILRDWGQLGRASQRTTEKQLRQVAGLAGITLDDLLYACGAQIEAEAKDVRIMRDAAVESS